MVFYALFIFSIQFYHIRKIDYLMLFEALFLGLFLSRHSGFADNFSGA